MTILKSWIVKFETDYFTEHYIFRVKPTKKQIRESRKDFYQLNNWMKNEDE